MHVGMHARTHTGANTHTHNTHNTHTTQTPTHTRVGTLQLVFCKNTTFMNSGLLYPSFSELVLADPS